MSCPRSLEEIKVEFDLVCLDIESLDDKEKVIAINHLEESLNILKLGNPLKLEPAEVEGPKRKFQNLYNGLVPTCEVCDIKFPTLGSLDNHMTKSHQSLPSSQKPKKSRVDVKIEGLSAMKGEPSIKRENTAGDETYQQCGDRLTPDRVTHTSKLECDRCKHRFSEQRKLRNHLKNKENCKKFLTTQKDKQLTEDQVFDKSVKEKKADEKNSDLKCVPCDVTFTHKKNLSRHKMRQSHQSKINAELTLNESESI